MRQKIQRHFHQFLFSYDIKLFSRISQASDKETIPKDDKKEDETAKDTNGDKNGDTSASNAKLSLGEIAAIDGEIAKAKTEQLQVLHNVRRPSILICDRFSNNSLLALLRQKWHWASN